MSRDRICLKMPVNVSKLELSHFKSQGQRKINKVTLSQKNSDHVIESDKTNKVSLKTAKELNYETFQKVILILIKFLTVRWSYLERKKMCLHKFITIHKILIQVIWRIIYLFSLPSQSGCLKCSQTIWFSEL